MTVYVEVITNQNIYLIGWPTYVFITSLRSLLIKDETFDRNVFDM